MGIAIRKEGFTTAGKVTLDIVETMLANGFVAKFPVTPEGTYQAPSGDKLEKFSITLEAGPTVDPLNKVEVTPKQPWRINFTVYDNATMGIVAGTPSSLPDDGSLPYTLRVGSTGMAPNIVTTNYYSSPKGVIGDPYTKVKTYVNPTGAEFATCIQWEKDGARDIMSNLLPSRHPDYNKTTGSAALDNIKYNEYPWDNSSMRGAASYPSFCVVKRVDTTQDDVTDKLMVQPDYLIKTQGFINRADKVWQGVKTTKPATGAIGNKEAKPVYPGAEKDQSAAFPMSYQLSITDRGMYLSVWQGAATDTTGEDFSWLLIQRPVKRDTGLVVTEGKAPVFAVFSVGNKIQRFVVRESDIVDASKNISAVEDTIDGTAIINDKRQIGVSESNQYIVNYPSRLNTTRFSYTYELDMIGYASATVVSGTTEIPQTLYGEESPRTYLGMHANMPANNGMRIVALISGGGIAPVV